MSSSPVLGIDLDLANGGAIGENRLVHFIVVRDARPSV